MRGAKCSPCKRFEAWEEDDYGTDQLGMIGGFLLHAGVAVNRRERKKLERICRYISRPALSEARLELTDQGMVRYVGAAFRLKTAYQVGITHVVFERGGLPYLDFMAKLAALVRLLGRLKKDLIFWGITSPHKGCAWRNRVSITLSLKQPGLMSKSRTPVRLDCM